MKRAPNSNGYRPDCELCLIHVLVTQILDFVSACTVEIECVYVKAHALENMVSDQKTSKVILFQVLFWGSKVILFQVLFWGKRTMENGYLGLVLVHVTVCVRSVS